MKKSIFLIVLSFIGLSYAKINYYLELNLKEYTDYTLYGKAVIEYTEKKPNINIPENNFFSRVKIQSIKEEKNKVVIDFFTGIEKSEEIVLTDNFYPQIDELAFYFVKLKLPEGFIPVSDADDIKKEGDWYIFDFPYKKEGVNIFIRKDYKVKSLKVRDDLIIYGYFFKNINENMLIYAKNYILIYEKLFGKFPYKRFSIVETSYPAGMSFPTFTVIYTHLINKKFILNTSLPHEVLHQWFGCSVYINNEKGNWAEGLTTYFSDYYFSKDKKIYRKEVLEKFDAIADKKLTLENFKYKKNKSYEAVGYGKGMFLFFMLENIVGKDNFINGLKDFYKNKKFSKASYNDIRLSIEKFYKKDLSYFFNQWIKTTYIPDISLKVKNVFYNIDHFEIKVQISQKENFKIKLPIVIQTVSKKEKQLVELFYKKTNITLKTKDLPIKIYIDPEYEIFRTLSNEETDPLLYYGYNVSDKLSSKDFEISKIENKTVLFIDDEFESIKQLIGNMYIPQEPFVLITKNPLGERKFLILTNMPKFYKVFIKHYGNYSMVFRDNPQKNIKNLCFYCYYNEIYEPPEVIDIKNGATTFDNLVKNIKNKKIIYIGENHTSFNEHIIQLQIIKEIFKDNEKIAIGMEMIQKPFQKHIDDYINGKISEKQFLQKIQYYKRWGYDYRLYKPIFDFAKENKIKIIALNIPKEITEKVRKCGISCLEKEEKEQLPYMLDFSNNQYRKFLKKIYNLHSNKKGKFAYFYENQIIWDETMAQSISEFIQENKEYKIIVLAGNGHLRYRYGIPERVERNTGIKGCVILNNDQIKPDIADFVIYTDKIKYKESYKLGVYIKEENNQVIVGKVVKHSLAEELGIKEKDIILMIDNLKIKSIYDIKLGLTFFKKGSTIKIKRGKNIKNIKY